MDDKNSQPGEPVPSIKVKTLDSSRKRLFSKELRCMMYGVGDDQNPYTESVDLLEDLVTQYIREVVRSSPVFLPKSLQSEFLCFYAY